MPLKKYQASTLTKLMIVTLISLLVLNISFFGISKYFFNSIQQNSFSVYKKGIESRLKETLVPIIWSFDFPTLDKVLESELRYPVIALEFKTTSNDTADHIVSKYSKDVLDPKSLRSLDASKWHSHINITNEKKDLGDLDIYYADNFDSTELGKLATYYIISAILFSIIIVLVYAYLNILVFRRNIRLLSKVLEDIDTNIDYLDDSKDTEFGVLKKKFNEVHRRYSTLIKALKVTQKELIQSEKMASLVSLIVGVSHELNTPMGTGLLTMSTMKDDASEFQKSYESGKGVTKARFVQFIQSQIEGLTLSMHSTSKALEVLESFKKLIATPGQEQYGDFELSQVVNDCLNILGSNVKNATLLVNVPKIQMKSYPYSIQHIIIHLVTNAAIHGYDDGGGTVSIKAEVIEGVVKIVVEDVGKGISPENISKVFDPFFTTSLGSGDNGLGLSIVYTEVTGILQGTIRVESELGKYTRFILEIPQDVKLKD